MLGKLLGHDKRLFEYVFAGDSLTPYAERSSVEDWRTFGDKALFRKLRPEGPAWTVDADGATFAAGAGALGVGSLWTRPVRLEPLDLEAAHVHVHERREVDGGAGGVSVIAHVRDRAVVGEAKDVDTRPFRLHAHDDASDETWHGHVLDLGDLLRGNLASDRYVTVEIRAESLKGARSPRAVALRVKPPILTLVAGGAPGTYGVQDVPRRPRVVEVRAELV